MFYDRRFVTIRKSHKCWGCNREFSKGTEMAYDSWIDSTKWVHGYFCSTCVDLINEYCKDYLDFEFCRGDLLEDALEYENRKNRKKDYILREDALKAIYTSTAPALEVKAMPAADVAPVRHGQWKPVSCREMFGGDPEAWYGHGDPIACHLCSKCNGYPLFDDSGNEVLSDFCPNCGAKMIGGKDNG